MVTLGVGVLEWPPRGTSCRCSRRSAVRQRRSWSRYCDDPREPPGRQQGIGRSWRSLDSHSYSSCHLSFRRSASLHGAPNSFSCRYNTGYRRCLRRMQVDQENVTSCLIRRHSRHCFLGGSRRMTNAWAGGKVARPRWDSAADASGKCRSFNRPCLTRRKCRRNGLDSRLERSPRPPLRHACRASMSQLLFGRADAAACGWRVPQCSDWHLNCLARSGLTWPGTRVRRPPGAGRQTSDFKASVFRISQHQRQERLNDEVQARVYLARRVHADTESARQNADQGIRFLPDAGAASAVGLRWLLDHAGRRPAAPIAC